MLTIAENMISSGQDSIWRERQGHHVSRVSGRLGNGGQKEDNNLCESRIHLIIQEDRGESLVSHKQALSTGNI